MYDARYAMVCEDKTNLQAEECSVSLESVIQTVGWEWVDEDPNPYLISSQISLSNRVLQISGQDTTYIVNFNDKPPQPKSLRSVSSHNCPHLRKLFYCRRFNNLRGLGHRRATLCHRGLDIQIMSLHQLYEHEFGGLALTCDESSAKGDGGGILAQCQSLLMSHSIFQTNYCGENGGSLMIHAETARFEEINCIESTAGKYGGFLYLACHSTTLIGLEMTDNLAFETGSCIHCQSPSKILLSESSFLSSRVTTPLLFVEKSCKLRIEFSQFNHHKPTCDGNEITFASYPFADDVTFLMVFSHSIDNSFRKIKSLAFPSLALDQLLQGKKSYIRISPSSVTAKCTLFLPCRTLSDSMELIETHAIETVLLESTFHEWEPLQTNCMQTIIIKCTASLLHRHVIPSYWP
ncbi:hypothetical protein BLNAU_16073 [Blattamonas nauphoetae]|uniref:Right handed beta helix domain-containing protein n=1 Tax=Blattamonas nauphoetae TaxID=2049346 RepID=A0ABQ9X8S5_9EUKA|nr:hypothetical protein BLNAU_16073 [Blattamonas nauphoetae]